MHFVKAVNSSSFVKKRGSSNPFGSASNPVSVVYASLQAIGASCPHCLLRCCSCCNYRIVNLGSRTRFGTTTFLGLLNLLKLVHMKAKSFAEVERAGLWCSR